MKIDNSLNKITSVRPGATGRGKEKTASRATEARPLGDSVELTPASSHLSALTESLAQIDSADAGKVESIRVAIAEGRFSVNEEAVADALLRDNLEQMSHQAK